MDWVGSKKACVATIRRLSPEKIERFLARRRRSLGGRSVPGFHSGTIRFLQFCMARRWLPAEFLDRVPSLRLHRGPWTPEAPRRRVAGAIASVSAASARRVLRSYARWLEDVRGLAISTIAHRLTTATTLLEFWLGDEPACVARLRRLDVNEVEAAFVRYRGGGHGHAAQRTFQTGLRLFLRFCATQGWGPRDLAAAVPSMRTYRLSTVPRAVSESDIPLLLAATAFSSSTPTRDRAIVLLLATYGIRRAQVAALRLSDIDWSRKRITFLSHKGGRTVQHSLTAATAEALADYLGERPAECKVEHVFLRSRPPHVGLSPVAVSCMIARLFSSADVESPVRGPHAFRHAFAQRLLAARKPFKTVADLLGHRSLSSAAIYAKVDTERLLEASLEWPEVLR